MCVANVTVVDVVSDKDFLAAAFNRHHAALINLKKYSWCFVDAVENCLAIQVHSWTNSSLDPCFISACALTHGEMNPSVAPPPLHNLQPSLPGNQ